MRKYLIITLIVLLCGTLAAIYIYSRVYNKPHIDVHQMEADIVISAESLIGAFQTDENAANQKYLDKIVLVTGEIRGIDIVNGNGLISLGNENVMGSVICNMDPGENKAVIGLEEGSMIKLKGLCTGFLMDVNLVRSVIVD